MNDRPHVDLAEVIEKGSERAAIVECAVRARSSEYMLGCVGTALGGERTSRWNGMVGAPLTS